MSQLPPAKRHPYDQWSPDSRALDLVGDKWTLLIVRDLMSGPRRFVELQRVLPGISTEQLRSRLNRMVADGMLTRQRYREVPPRVDYELTDRARDLAPVLGELARWGYEWSWGAPRPNERVDVGAIFRLLPGLMRPGTLPPGTLALTVTDGAARSHTLVSVAAHAVTIGESSQSVPADASLSGTIEDWVRALGPAADASGLQGEGREDLREAVLEQLWHGHRRERDLASAVS
ncbi:MAG TPA: helix-turn-helix domain-containing protein [Solirubrobacteraceae bacterium]|nr:helix-turn-helix domain-containing protein [Solirubrobacteraceae bacterium]